MIWWILTAAAAVALLAYWGSRNAVWGTATFGALVGLVIAFIQPGFEWATVGKSFVIGALVGVGFEWLPRIVQRGDRRRSTTEPQTEDLYESVRHILTEDEIAHLFQLIDANEMASATDKAKARSGLAKLLDELATVIPTDDEISSLSLFFPPDLIEAIREKKTT